MRVMQTSKSPSPRLASGNMLGDVRVLGVGMGKRGIVEPNLVRSSMCNNVAPHCFFRLFFFALNVHVTHCCSFGLSCEVRRTTKEC
jgi:hypothetical protein